MNNSPLPDQNITYLVLHKIRQLASKLIVSNSLDEVSKWHLQQLVISKPTVGPSTVPAQVMTLRYYYDTLLSTYNYSAAIQPHDSVQSQSNLDNIVYEPLHKLLATLYHGKKCVGCQHPHCSKSRQLFHHVIHCHPQCGDTLCQEAHILLDHWGHCPTRENCKICGPVLLKLPDLTAACRLAPATTTSSTHGFTLQQEPTPMATTTTRNTVSPMHSTATTTMNQHHPLTTSFTVLPPLTTTTLSPSHTMAIVPDPVLHEVSERSATSHAGGSSSPHQQQQQEGP